MSSCTRRVLAILSQLTSNRSLPARDGRLRSGAAPLGTSRVLQVRGGIVNRADLIEGCAASWQRHSRDPIYKVAFVDDTRSDSVEESDSPRGAPTRGEPSVRPIWSSGRQHSGAVPRENSDQFNVCPLRLHDSAIIRIFKETIEATTAKGKRDEYNFARQIKAWWAHPTRVIAG
jgi:hypothetical protein